jgi:hypothetical protein
MFPRQHHDPVTVSRHGPQEKIVKEIRDPRQPKSLYLEYVDIYATKRKEQIADEEE